MAKRPSLFAPKPQLVEADTPSPATTAQTDKSGAGLPPSRVGKRVLSIYLDPLALKQLHQLALDNDTTNQALGEEAINLLFAKHGLNRSA